MPPKSNASVARSKSTKGKGKGKKKKKAGPPPRQQSLTSNRSKKGTSDLNHLANVTGLFVQQSVEPLEVITGINFNNRYSILDTRGQRMYDALEKSTAFSICFLGGERPFEMEVRNGKGVVVAFLKRSCTYCLCWWGASACSGNEVVIHDGNKGYLGRVTQNCNCCTPDFTVNDDENRTFCRIIGPSGGNLCPDCMCTKAVFTVVDLKGKKVGKITKHWSGVFQEFFTNADVFGITFPKDWAVTKKAVVLGAIFLIDFQYFEKQIKQPGVEGRKMGGCTGCCVALILGILILQIVIIAVILSKS